MTNYNTSYGAKNSCETKFEAAEMIVDQTESIKIFNLLKNPDSFVQLDKLKSQRFYKIH